jgi:hypothetical protein
VGEWSIYTSENISPFPLNGEMSADVIRGNMKKEENEKKGKKVSYTGKFNVKKGVRSKYRYYTTTRKKISEWS